MLNPQRISPKTALLLLAALCIGAAAFVSVAHFSSAQTTRPDLTQAETCAAAQTYAQTRLSADMYRFVTLGECGPLSPVQGVSGVWNVNGLARGTQYGAPMQITWTANAFRGSDGHARVCAFGSNARQYPPRALAFVQCR